MATDEEERDLDDGHVPNPYLVQLGLNIRKARRLLGLTHEGVRKRIKTTGTNLFLIETGLRDTRVSSLRTLASALETTPQALLPREDETELEKPDFKHPKTVHRAIARRLTLLTVEMEELKEMLRTLEANTPD
ncbi:MAG: helix-turn-helix domain-containing protein [Janthinobacterium lividum]